MPHQHAKPAMRDSASKARVNYETPFNQGYDLAHVPQALTKPGAELHYVAPGVCTGLALSWLKNEAAGGPNTLLDDVKLPVTTDPAPSRSYQLLKEACYLHRKFDPMPGYETVASEQRRLGLKPRAKLDDHEQVMKVADADIKDKEELKKLTAWLGKTMKKRYFLINSGNHSMAATGSKFGGLKFFDPNEGVVRAANADKMAEFLFDYFSQKRHYFRAVQSIDAYKFSATSRVDGGESSHASESNSK